MPKTLQLLIKPASSGCNENCSYCFYMDEAARRAVADRGMMSHETAELLIRRAFEYADESCDFIFQGGEPLLAGIDFYKDFVSTAKRLNAAMHKDKPLELSWSVQTNASLIDDDFAPFFKDNNFLVGVSIDGPRDIHDSQRGEGSFNRAHSGIDALRRAGVDFNALCVVTEESCKHAEVIYEYFKSEGFTTQQYIPCLAPLLPVTAASFVPFPKDTAASYASLSPDTAVYCAPSPKAWGRFLCEIFDLWKNDIKQGKIISIRYFENIARVLLGMAPESCGMSGRCSLQFTIESDGDVYPCDFYALDDFRLGNIMHSGFAEMQNYDTAVKFTDAYEVSCKCRACNYYRLCRGGCKREREAQSPDCTRLCDGYYMFFEHAVDRLWTMLQRN